MLVRGAPLIGATAAYGVCLAMRDDDSDEALDCAYAVLYATRPTAVNLRWALDEMRAALRNRPRGERLAAAYARAAERSDEHTSELQSLMRISYAVFGLTKKTTSEHQANMHICKYSRAHIIYD